VATYRLQLHRDFGFDDAAALCDHLRALGVSHVYCSPSLQAVPGSMHGYDVVDPTRLSTELGGETAHARLRAACATQGLGLLLDVVPNHMAAHAGNPWWWDVLEDGQRSPWAPFFDVDWEAPLDPALRGRVLLPILGDHLGRCCERGEVRLERRREDGRIVMRYHAESAPLSLPSLAGLLDGAARSCGSAVLHAAARGAAALADASLGVEERQRRRVAVWAEIRDACTEDDDAARALDAQLDTVNADAAALVALLQRQNHRPARWQLAARVAGYRRFFDVSSLVALRAEDPRTFRATHALVLDMVRDGGLDGLRIDHVDGLRDLAAYLRELRAQCGEGAWIVVEKILGAGETLPDDWPVAGSTGYDFGALSTRLLTDPSGETRLLQLHASLGGGVDLAAETRRAKREVMDGALRGDVDRLALLLRDVCAGRPRHSDHALDELRAALVELIAALPVYRTYAVPGHDASAEDAARMRCARDAAAAARPDLDRELLDLVGSLVVDAAERDGDAAATELVQRLQQLSAAVMAKGVEDTLFYRFVPLAALNEVGGAPLPFSLAADDFHAHNRLVQQRWPEALLATTTHDTKRSEDVRARLVLLAEMPERWAATVRAWSGRNAAHRSGAGRPDALAEHLLYQSMVGAWPVDRERMLAYMEKASREAKLHTSWTEPAAKYDAALRRFVAGVYADAGFLAEVEAFVAGLLEPGRANALALALLKLTSPGVPDLYQGTELWTLSLVDPDNRRPVDFAERRRLLEQSRHITAVEAWRVHAGSGLPKLLLTRRALQLRRRCPELFDARGDYTPLPARGARADHAVAFARGAPAGAVTVVPRFPLTLAGDWADTTVAVPEGEWHDQLTGARRRGGGDLPLGELLGEFPVALLARQPCAEDAA